MLLERPKAVGPDSLLADKHFEIVGAANGELVAVPPLEAKWTIAIGPQDRRAVGAFSEPQIALIGMLGIATSHLEAAAPLDADHDRGRAARHTHTECGVRGSAAIFEIGKAKATG